MALIGRVPVVVACVASTVATPLIMSGSVPSANRATAAVGPLLTLPRRSAVVLVTVPAGSVVAETEPSSLRFATVKLPPSSASRAASSLAFIVELGDDRVVADSRAPVGPTSAAIAT